MLPYHISVSEWTAKKAAILGAIFSGTSVVFLFATAVAMNWQHGSGGQKDWGMVFGVAVGVPFVCCSVAALLSGSRTFFGSLIPALLVYAFLQKKHLMKTLYLICGLMLIWGTVSYVAPNVVSQFTQRVDSVGVIDYSRLAASAQAMLEIAQKPIFGWGADHFDEGGVVYLPDTGEVTGAHNTLLRYWYATGILGAIGFLMFFIAPFRQLRKALKLRISERLANAVRLSMAATLFFFIVTNLGPYIFNRYIFIPLFVVAGFAARLVQSANAVAAQRAPMQLSRNPIPRPTA